MQKLVTTLAVCLVLLSMAACQPIALEDAINNMRVIDAVFRSANSKRWEVL